MVLPLFALAACGNSKRISKDFAYFQRGLDSMGTVAYKEPVIQPNDLLTIQVYSSSLSQEQATLFNLPNTNTTGSGGYLVDIQGNITMPLVGKIGAGGLTRAQLGQKIEKTLDLYVKGPSVVVRYLQFRVNVLGEVKSPGTKNFSTDRVTIIDALGAAGDLTDYGKRNNIMVFREENGERKMYEVDLRSAAIFQSPVYQLQQNDLVYVNANKSKLGQVDVNPKTQRDLSLGLSIITGISFLLNTYILLTR
jgi:polysaccharide export outer membrane protein